MIAPPTQPPAGGPVDPQTLWPRSRRIDDMADVSGDGPPSPRLEAAVAVCRSVLTPAFHDYDRSALRQQRSHRWIVQLAATVGTFAVVVAIIQLALAAELQA